MKRSKACIDQSGFTLVELMIALFIGAVIAVATYSSYRLQVKTSTAQDAVSQMQQNLRAGLDILADDLKMAGYDPTDAPTPSGNFGFVDNVEFDSGGGIDVYTNATQIAFTRDLDGDGTVDDEVEDVNGDGTTDLSETEQIAYKVEVDAGDGITKLFRYSNAGTGQWLEVAEYIEAIEFHYTLEDGTLTATPTATELAEIRSVQISLLARAEQRDAQYVNNNTYTPASGNAWDLNGDAAGNAPGDNYRRRLLVTKINCRNMGI